MPKLSIAVACSCHLILAARATVGMGSDHPHFAPLLFDAWCRAEVRVMTADAGYDSEENHRVGRDEAGVVTMIPPLIGRPTEKAPVGRTPAGNEGDCLRPRRPAARPTASGGRSRPSTA